jgi:dolichol-phosphate hexosyltransferase
MPSVRHAHGTDTQVMKVSCSGAMTSPQMSESGLTGVADRSGSGVSPQAYGRLLAEGPVVKLSILMPVYNEERTIIQAIDAVLATKYPCDMELLVVDDGSTDQTPMLLAQVNDARVQVYRHPVNRGKGAALLSAASLATGTHVLPFDADLEYSPDDIPRMLAPISAGRCSVVYGVRLRGYNTVFCSYVYAAANRFLSRLANVLFNACITDLHTCLKLMPLPLLKSLNLRENRFGLDTEITAALLRIGVRPFEVAASYRGRSRMEGKKITWRDAVICILILLRIRLRLRPKLMPLSSHAHELGDGVIAKPGEQRIGGAVASIAANRSGEKLSASATGLASE